MEAIEILLVEDNVGDVPTGQILAESSTPVNLQVAVDGMQALLILAGWPKVTREVSK